MNTKKLLIALCLVCAPLSAGAQEVYRLVLESAERTLRDPSSGFAMTRIAQFKKAALVYMKDQTGKSDDAASTADRLLDTQAYYLSEFTTLYARMLARTKRTGAEKQQERVRIFMDASHRNPLFSDPNTSATDAYVQTGNEITPFSLNTDWEKAFEEVKRKL